MFCCSVHGRRKHIIRGSDIDLGLVGEISHNKLLDIKSRLNELNYLFTFDALIYSNIQNEVLKKHIDGAGISFIPIKNTLEE